MFIIFQNVIILLIILLIIVLSLLSRVKWIHQMVFGWLFMQVLEGYIQGLMKYKKEHFAPLQNFSSLDGNLRKKGVIRILEIGVGPGTNFEYYPKNSRVSVIDPNPNFKKTFEEYSSKFPDLKIEKVLLGVGEDLGAIEDDSVDIVVTTIVLCSVENVQQVLSEIHRVLAPGGKYFFMEHVIAKPGSWLRLRQTLIKPIWKIIFCGCQVTRNIEDDIRKMGFVRMEFKYVSVKLALILELFISLHVYGSVQKKA